MFTRVAAIAAVVVAAQAFGQTVDPFYAANYSIADLGPPPGVPPALGGITFLRNDPNTVLIGGGANGGGGTVYRIGVVRDAQQQITGWVGTAEVFSTAPWIDGGLCYNLDGVLFFAAYPTNQIGYIQPGGTTPARTFDLNTTPGNTVGSSTGTVQFIPPGFRGAGSLIVGSYNGGGWDKITLLNDGPLHYAIGGFIEGPASSQTNGGPEGIVYIPTSNVLFSDNQYVLISEYGFGFVRSYAIDNDGFPIADTRRDFITGLGGVEGATLDPITGQFMFSTFGGGNRVIVVRGFVPRPPCIPDVAGVGGAIGPDGQLTPDDLLAFLTAFFNNNLAVADIAILGGAAGHDGLLTPDDVVLYLSKFFEGCPL
ncbi:MAG: GC-type dockerin domain-anchored protein [Phycisphaerales bacterium]